LDKSGRKTARAAIYGYAFPGAVRVFTGLGQLFECCVEIVGYKQVQRAVVVIVDPGAAGAVARGGLAQSGLVGHIRERSIAVIVIKHILTVVSDKDVVETIIVVVTHSHCRSPACADQSSFDR